MIDRICSAARPAGALLLLAVAAAACGTTSSTPTSGISTTSGEPDTVAGRELFVRNCGLCHTLADAGTEGTLGPSLDQLQPEHERVVRMIDTGGGAMPPDLVEGQEAEDIAAYVAEAAGRTPEDGDDDASGGGDD